MYRLNRGDIYTVAIPHATGFEMTKQRPAVIVSSDEINLREGVVIVAFCSASEQYRDSAAHAMIRSTGRPSNVLCEHVYTVDKSRLLVYRGRVTDDELERIDIALASALGIDFAASRAIPEPHMDPPEEDAQADVESRETILKTAVMRFGQMAQTDVMIEEMSELTKALCKYKRALTCGTLEAQQKLDVLEEMADVQVMLDQMKLLYGDCREQETAKLERLARRLCL